MAYPSKRYTFTWRLALLAGASLFAALAMPAAAAVPNTVGIEVHGNWRITIYNPDGSTDRVVEFTNALVGPGLIASFLSGGILFPASGFDIPANWTISTVASGVDTGNATCLEGLTGMDATDAAPSHPASVSTNNNGALVLSRQFSLPSACVTGASYDITEVSTTYFVDRIIQSGSAYDFLQYMDLTAKTLDTPLAGILANQTVAIDVTISFQ